MANKGNKERKMSREEAGRKGGETTAARHGRAFYQDIGSRGGSMKGRGGEDDTMSGGDDDSDML